MRRTCTVLAVVLLLSLLVVPGSRTSADDPSNHEVYFFNDGTGTPPIVTNQIDTYYCADRTGQYPCTLQANVCYSTSAPAVCVENGTNSVCNYSKWAGSYNWGLCDGTPPVVQCTKFNYKACFDADMYTQRDANGTCLNYKCTKIFFINNACLP